MRPLKVLLVGVGTVGEAIAVVSRDRPWIETMVHPNLSYWSNESPVPQTKASLSRWNRYDNTNATVLEQELFAEGLLQKLHSSILHRPHRDRDVAMTGDEDDRHVDALLAQVPLQFQAAHLRHAHVQHQAAGRSDLVGSQKFAR